MLQDLKEIQERFEPYLKKDYYTFIGPVDDKSFKEFVKEVNLIAAVVSFHRSIHHALQNKEAVLKALNYFPPNIALKIYVIQKIEPDEVLLHDTIKSYCEKNNIEFQI